MNIVRAYKLLKLGIAISDNDKEMIDYLDHKFKDLKPVELEECPNSIFYFNSDNQCIFEITKNNELYVKKEYDEIYDTLQKNYLLDYDKTIEIINFFIKKEYNLKIDETLDRPLYWMQLIEKKYKETL